MKRDQLWDAGPREKASTQNAPGGGNKEAKTEHQDEKVNINDAFNPPVDGNLIKPTVSPIERALNVTERHLTFFNNHMETARRARKETANQESAADPAKAAQRRSKPDKALDAQQNAETGQDNLQQVLQGMRTPRSPLLQSANSNRSQDQNVNPPQNQNASAATAPVAGTTRPTRQTNVRTSNVTGGGGGGSGGSSGRGSGGENSGGESSDGGGGDRGNNPPSRPSDPPHGPPSGPSGPGNNP